MEDAKIVQLYFDRSEAAIAETARKYGKYCYSIAYNILMSRPDAEETVNDTYLGAWRAIPPHKPQRLNTFLGKITRRLALAKWKARTARKRGGGETALALEELGECIPDNNTPERAVELKELSAHLNAFLKTLPDTEQQVFVSRYWYVNPVKDVATQFGFSESKVKSMLSRTRKKLAAYLQKEGILI